MAQRPEEIEAILDVLPFVFLIGGTMVVILAGLQFRVIFGLIALGVVALASEEIAIRKVVDREIETYDPYEGAVMVWTT